MLCLTGCGLVTGRVGFLIGRINLQKVEGLAPATAAGASGGAEVVGAVSVWSWAGGSSLMVWSPVAVASPVCSSSLRLNEVQSFVPSILMQGDCSGGDGGRSSHGADADAEEDDTRGDGKGAEGGGRGTFGAGADPEEEGVSCGDGGDWWRSGRGSMLPLSDEDQEGRSKTGEGWRI